MESPRVIGVRISYGGKPCLVGRCPAPDILLSLFVHLRPVAERSQSFAGFVLSQEAGDFRAGKRLEDCSFQGVVVWDVPSRLGMDQVIL